jgi:predicted amidophosphoribosyltransferase
MTVECPTCGYDIPTDRGLTCPRCGEAIECASVGCSECSACTDPVTMIGTRLAERVSGGREKRPGGDD